MKILFLSHTFYGGVFRVGSHHLFDKFYQDGIQVVHTSTPFSMFHKVAALSFKRGDANFDLRMKIATGNLSSNQKIPFTIFPITLKISSLFPGRAIRNILKTEYDYILVDQPLFFRFLSLFPKNAKIVLRLTDKPNKKMIKLINRNIESVSSIVVTNAKILEFLNHTAIPTLIRPNGYHETFLPKKRDIPTRKGLVYVGALDSRIDWEFVAHLSTLPEFRFMHIYGSGKVPVQLPQGVSHLGSINYSDIPRVYETYKYGVLPFKLSESNFSRSPIKLAEYLASDLEILIPKGILHEYQTNLKFEDTEDSMQHIYSKSSMEVIRLSRIHRGRVSSWRVVADEILNFIVKSNN